MIEKYRPNPERPKLPLDKLVRFMRNPGSELRALLSGSPLSQSGAESIPQNGSKAIVPEPQWVACMNERGVHNGNSEIKFGNKCGVEEGGSVSL